MSETVQEHDTIQEPEPAGLLTVGDIFEQIKTIQQQTKSHFLAVVRK